MSKIKVGATLPDYELPDENGDLRRLSELQGDDIMVLSLGRGEHCPRERQHQRELLRFYEWCSVAFTQLVTILPNDLHDVLKLKISTGAHWTYLADSDLEVQNALDIREYTDPIHTANVPHTLILSPGRKIEKVYVGYWFWGRPSPYQLWQDLQELSMRIKPDFDPTTPAAKAAWKKQTTNGKVPAHR
jgi:peroxiredoxin